MEELFLSHPNIHIDSKDEFGNTYLIMASKCGNIDLVDILLSKGANLNLTNVNLNYFYKKKKN